MYSLGYDVVVEDEEFSALGSCLTVMADEFESKLSAYCDSLTRVATAAIKEGVVAENLSTFNMQVRNLQRQSTTLAQQISQVLTRFVTEMDRADADMC